MTEQAGRDVLTGWKIDREQKIIYMGALEESEQKIAQLKEIVSEEFANIKRAHDEDRASWQKRTAKGEVAGHRIFCRNRVYN